MDKNFANGFAPEVHVCLHEESIDKWGVEATGLVSGAGIGDGSPKDKEAVADKGMGLVGIGAVMGGIVMFITCNHEEGEFMICHVPLGERCNQEVDPNVI